MSVVPANVSDPHRNRTAPIAQYFLMGDLSIELRRKYTPPQDQRMTVAVVRISQDDGIRARDFMLYEG